MVSLTPPQIIDESFTHQPRSYNTSWYGGDVQTTRVLKSQVIFLNFDLLGVYVLGGAVPPLTSAAVWFAGEQLRDADQPEPEAQQQQRLWLRGSLGLHGGSRHVCSAR